jgi:TfoX/Sxy family transcriptional regulator of competence genes
VSVKDLYDDAAGQLLATDQAIEPTRMFGSDGLQVADKTFAMVVKGALVVKLPAPRVEELITAGSGQRFDPGHGRVMKEWVSLEPGNLQIVIAYMTEAATFVAGLQRKKATK